MREVIVHQDVLEADMNDMRILGQDVSDYERVLNALNKKKEAVKVPYAMSPQELADMFEPGDAVTLSGCYGSSRECIEEYGNALRQKGVTVNLDESAILE